MMDYPRFFRWACMGVFGLAVLASLFLMGQRIGFESDNRRVELVMSAAEIAELAAVGGVDADELVVQLRSDFGLTSVALEEDTIDSWIQAGQLTVLEGSEITNMLRVGRVYRYVLTNIIKKIDIQSDRLYLFVDETARYDRLKAILIEELGASNVVEIGYHALEVRASLERIYEVGLGIDAQRVAEFETMGVQVVARLQNSDYVTDALIKLKFASIEDASSAIKTIIFDGESVLGYPYRMSLVTELMTEYGFNLGFVEFSTQTGDRYLAKNGLNRLVRVHSMQPAYQEKVAMTRAIRRYVRAVKERNARVLFLHPYLKSTNSEPLITSNFRYISSIRSQLEGMGYQIGAVTQVPIDRISSLNPWLVLAVSFGIFLAATVAINAFFALPMWGIVAGGIGVLVLYYMSLLFGADMSWRRLMALIGVIVFPVYAVVGLFPQEALPYRFVYRLMRALGFIFGAVAWCLVGGLLSTSLLSEPVYLLSVTQFYGVKFSILLPLVFVGLYFYLRPHRLKSMFFVFKRVLLSPVRVVSLVALALSFVVIVTYLLRSGNYLSFQLPLVETWLREGLESVLFVRPRTKEFLIGYPLLLVGYVLVDRWVSRQWLWFFTTLGVVALVSLMNSFCHIHTPFLISVYRSMLGMGLGCLVGGLYLGIIFGLKWIYERLHFSRD